MVNHFFATNIFYKIGQRCINVCKYVCVCVIEEGKKNMCAEYNPLRTITT